MVLVGEINFPIDGGCRAGIRNPRVCRVSQTASGRGADLTTSAACTNTAQKCMGQAQIAQAAVADEAALPLDPIQPPGSNPPDLEDGGGKEEKRQTPVTEARVVLARKDRRGLLGRWTLLQEVEDPLSYSKQEKNLIVFIIATAALNAPFGSSIFLPSVDQIAHDFNTPASMVSLSVAFYMLALGVGPIWWSALSEEKGRRSVYVISFGLNVVFTLLCGFARNIGMLTAFRLLAGLSSASVQSVGAGTISDIYVSNERGTAFGFYYLGPLVGPFVAPIVGGALAQRFTWRATMWFVTVLSVLEFAFILFLLPETWRPKHDTEQTISHAHLSLRLRIWQWLIDVVIKPLRCLLLLQYPPVLLAVLENSVIFGTLYCMNITISLKFSDPPYNYPTSIVGVFYLPNSVGYVIGSIVGGRWSDYILKREARRKNGGVEIPENRIGENCWIAAAGVPAGLFVFGWTLHFHTLVAGPLVGSFWFGLSLMLIFSTTNTYVVDSIRGKSAGAMAANNFVRNVFSCTGTVVAEPLLDSIGAGPLFSILGGINIFAIFFMIGIYLYGPRWRERYAARLDALQK